MNSINDMNNRRMFKQVTKTVAFLLGTWVMLHYPEAYADVIDDMGSKATTMALKIVKYIGTLAVIGGLVYGVWMHIKEKPSWSYCMTIVVCGAVLASAAQVVQLVMGE